MIGARRMRRGSRSDDISTAPAMSILPCALRQRGFIDLDRIFKQAAVGIDHGAPQVVQQPRTLCSCQARAGPVVAGQRCRSSG